MSKEQPFNIVALTEKQYNDLIAKIENLQRTQNRVVDDMNAEFSYTEEEVAQILKCSKKTIQNWRNTQDIEYIQVGMVIRYTKKHIQDFCERHKVKARWS